MPEGPVEDPLDRQVEQARERHHEEERRREQEGQEGHVLDAARLVEDPAGQDDRQERSEPPPEISADRGAEQGEQFAQLGLPLIRSPSVASGTTWGKHAAAGPVWEHH